MIEYNTIECTVTNWPAKEMSPDCEATGSHEYWSTLTSAEGWSALKKEC